MSKAFEKHFVRSNVKRTICEVLREIYWYTTDPTIRTKVEEATTMAKKMDKKLHQYKHGWDEHEWEEFEKERADQIAAERRAQYEEEQK